MADAKSVPVFSAHAADFVWRAGGAKKLKQLGVEYVDSDPDNS